ncbi:unnamed protein product [Phytophthora lilii]|uniref:Unnamed protein product n=1 Tax=Phytophthora lilii TaxID=2077276 RepID=A0A9W6YJW3_9STRA|nr:unnamed protein product [Phytophthora lilii]
MECFERGLELTSVNCGFCRRRVVGFARTKRYKVDEAMWTAIQTQCPFLKDAADDAEPVVEFFDEDAPPLHAAGEDHPTAASEESSGDLKAFYEKQLRQHQSQVKQAEQRALEQTIEFLQNDPEFTASLAASSSPASSTSSSSSAGPRLPRTQAAKKKVKLTTPMATRTTSHRPVTRSASNAADEKQPKLDHFFAASRATSSHSGQSGQSLRRAHSTSVGLVSPRARTLLKIDEPHKKYFLRSASHSPTPSKQRRRQPINKSRKNLLQLTLKTTISPVALHTRSRDLRRAGSVGSESKMLTRQSRRRSSWKCAQCTYTNTCFDSCCSMCRSLPPPEAYNALSSQ